jgi:SARP family transcriptional regulator, regulator of embCAB operon
MARQVDNVWLPGCVSGHPALELNSTVGGWGFDEPREYLVDYRVLVILARDVELLDGDEAAPLLDLANRRPDLAGAALRDSKRLREAMHAVLLDPSGPALDRVHGFVAAAVRESRYRPASGGALRLDGGDGPRRPVHRFALALHSLLEQYPARAIRPCADERCGWIFLDPSGRRRWCEMSVCGNRAKARRYAERHKR